MKKVIIGAVAAAILLLVGIVAGYLWLVAPVTKGASAAVMVTVKKGEGVAALANDLVELGVIKNALAFRVLAKLEGETGLVPGVFEVNPTMSGSEVLQVLKTKPEELTITILPGWRREEIAEYLEGLNLSDFDGEEFLRLTEGMEGQLMAETYRIFPNETAEKIVEKLHQQYLTDLEENEEIQTLVKASGRSWQEILTVASLLQREARDEEQMRNIAAILYRRLADNYPLQLCATAQYATGKDAKTGKWWEAPTLEDTQYDSEYNTYQYKGLPPAPIASVSVAAVRAALAPAENDYYFYLHDNQGRIHYAKTLEEHDVNKAEFL